MTRYIAFLRAINVGGRNVRMSVLREQFEGLGLTSVETFIASGNVIFCAEKAGRKAAAGGHPLEAKIEKKLREALGYEVATFIRTAAEVAIVAKHQAFSDELLQTAAALNVAFLPTPLDASGRKRLEEFESDIDTFHAHDRQVYWLCRKKQSESRFSSAAFERVLQVRATFRSLGTVRKLADKYGAEP